MLDVCGGDGGGPVEMTGVDVDGETYDTSCAYTSTSHA